jgi:hypothetical protein
MKIFLTSLCVATIVLLWSCQRELFFDGVSSGFLKKDGTGNCLPIATKGIFTIDTVLNSSNYIEVQAEVVMPGSYDIKSNTVNGYSFSSTGSVVKGTNTIRLYGNGKPKASGIDHFSISYDNSTCDFTVKISNTPLASFILGGAPNFCTGVFENGEYIKGVPLTYANTVTLLVNVIVPGKYNVTASTNNGFQFDGSGIFTSTGVQNVTLTGTGTPIKDEVTNVTVSNIVSACNFGLTVKALVDPKAIFSFDGTPGSCINFVVNGAFYAGLGVTVNHTVTMNVSVTKTGTYTINTNAANGISFSASGVFTALGNQTVVLVAKGTPVKQESTAFIPNTGTLSCNFFVDVLPLPPPAVFTLAGAPNDCTPVTVNGFYIHTKPLDAANTVIIQVIVTTPGSYNFSTNTTNGMQFTASGVFTSAGLQNVILRGVGTPVATGTTVVTPRNITSACNFNITVQ